MSIPNKYQWILAEPGPKMIAEALKEYGTSEVPAAADNPKIVAWAKEVGGAVEDYYKADAIEWCGLFMAVVAKQAGKPFPAKPLWALNWAAFGKPADSPMLGDILVFTRITPEGKKAGRVGLYVGESDSTYHVLGGNQDDKVRIKEYAKSRFYAARRPKYNNQPANVRSVFINSDGIAFGNES